jgi:hypothetical protein
LVLVMHQLIFLLDWFEIPLDRGRTLLVHCLWKGFIHQICIFIGRFHNLHILCLVLAVKTFNWYLLNLTDDKLYSLLEVLLILLQFISYYVFKLLILSQDFAKSLRYLSKTMTDDTSFTLKYIQVRLTGELSFKSGDLL